MINDWGNITAYWEESERREAFEKQKLFFTVK